MITIDKCQHKSDINLVKLTLADQDYFLCLMEKYKAPLARYIIRLSNIDSDSAEDVLQDIFIKIYQNLNAFDQSLKFSSWIYRIAHNEIISHYRQLKARPQLIGGEASENVIK